MLKKIKIISNIIGWIVFTFLLCFLFILISPKLPIKNVPKTFIVASGSMEPTIKTGSVAFVKEVNSKTIKTGDIIAFTSPSDPKETILHRVALISSTNPLTFKTKGDHNNGIDTWDVMGVGVKGTYITAVPYLGYIGVFIRKPIGFGLIVGIPALIFIIFQLLNIKKAIAEEIDRKVSQKIADSKKTDSTSTILKTLIFLTIFSTLFSFTSIRTIKAVFSDTVTISGINISIADFTKPSVPVLTSPIGFTNDTTPLMQWEDSTFYQKNVTIGYHYRIKYNCTNIDDPDTCSAIYPNTTGLWLNSSQYQAGVTNNGVYYWQVQSCLATDNCSDWSHFERMIIDSNIPSSVITSPLDSSQNNNPSLSIISSWDGKITGTAADNLSGIDHVELSIQDLGTSLFWSGTGWTGGTESTVRVKAIGDTNWSYQINSTNLSSGNFKIVAHAVDKAGNIENSATIEFENIDSVETITETPTKTPIETPSLTPTPTETSIIIPTSTETPTLTPTETPFISLTPTETPIITSTLTETITPTPTETITPTPTTTPIPTSVPTPIPTETPVNIENDPPVTINPTGSQIITKVFNC